MSNAIVFRFSSFRPSFPHAIPDDVSRIFFPLNPLVLITTLSPSCFWRHSEALVPWTSLTLHLFLTIFSNLLLPESFYYLSTNLLLYISCIPMLLWPYSLSSFCELVLLLSNSCFLHPIDLDPLYISTRQSYWWLFFILGTRLHANITEHQIICSESLLHGEVASF